MKSGNGLSGPRLFCIWSRCCNASPNSYQGANVKGWPTSWIPKTQEGLEFRSKLMKYMPQGIVDFDHSEGVNALAQGQVAMITEWSAFYQTLVNPNIWRAVACGALRVLYQNLLMFVFFEIVVSELLANS